MNIIIVCYVHLYKFILHKWPDFGEWIQITHIIQYNINLVYLMLFLYMYLKLRYFNDAQILAILASNPKTDMHVLIGKFVCIYL